MAQRKFAVSCQALAPSLYRGSEAFKQDQSRERIAIAPTTKIEQPNRLPIKYMSPSKQPPECPRLTRN
jgi:hypothetical protein